MAVLAAGAKECACFAASNRYAAVGRADTEFQDMDMTAVRAMQKAE